MTRHSPLALALCLVAPSAMAQYAEPPSETVVVAGDVRYDHAHPDDLGGCDAPRPPFSTVRLVTGPALRLGRDEPAGGLGVALDIGRGAAGVRMMGSWFGVGRETGIMQYTGEIWLDFGYGHRLHPLLGVGGGAATIEAMTDSGEVETNTVGVGVVRTGLQYALPVWRTDARAGLDVSGVVPAVRSTSGPEGEINAWLVAAGTVTVGF